jgi:hypothetical protein
MLKDTLAWRCQNFVPSLILEEEEEKKKKNKGKYLFDAQQIWNSARFGDLFRKLVSLRCSHHFSFMYHTDELEGTTKL